MTNPTETNQGSEEELYNIRRTLAYDAMESGVDNSKHGYIYNAIDELLPTAKAAIQSAIRTEKLKLLAEVRERERSYFITDLELLEHQTGDDEIIAVPVSEITKLEAEL